MHHIKDPIHLGNVKVIPDSEIQIQCSRWTRAKRNKQFILSWLALPRLTLDFSSIAEPLAVISIALVPLESWLDTKQERSLRSTLRVQVRKIEQSIAF